MSDTVAETGTPEEVPGAYQPDTLSTFAESATRPRRRPMKLPRATVTAMPTIAAVEALKLANACLDSAVAMLKKYQAGKLKPGAGQGEADVFRAVMEGTARAFESGRMAREMARTVVG